MAKKKTTTGQTSARMVMDVLKKHYAFTPDTAVGYDAFKNLRLSTSVIAYTIANLMETDVIMKTDDDRYYFVEKNWNKVVRLHQYDANRSRQAVPGCLYMDTPHPDVSAGHHASSRH